MPESLARLLDAVRRASSLDDVAHSLLSAMLRTAASASSQYVDARVERSVLHLRPRGGYEGLLVLEPGEAEVRVPERDPSFLSSATAWHHVQDHRVPMAIDVLVGRLTVNPAEPTHPQPEGNFDGQKTLTLMRQRQTTHVLVLPIFDVGGTLKGQISLEARCMEAVGREFIWPACVTRLQTLVDLAAPYLLRLPESRREEPAADPMLPVIGRAMRPIVRNLRVFAQHDETLLLLGATGTGKSRLARWCHSRSRRTRGPFEVVDLSSVPEDLHQGELFGWRKGAFTGAGRDHMGAIGRAAGGTLFIDEIDKLDRRSQASLLRVLEDGSYRAIGDQQIHRCDVRFIVGTNADLDLAIAEGRFLPDLYYRINVLPVRLPTLAERRDEIADWASFMVERRTGARPRGALTSAALQPLLEHHWPGNLRQLDNVLRRALALALVDLDERESEPECVTIDGEHIAAALMMEHTGRFIGASVGLHPMERAAAWVAARAARRFAKGSVLPLETIITAFRGQVLLAALEASSLEDAFGSLGRGNLVKSRNHRKSLRTAKEQIEALRAMIDET